MTLQLLWEEYKQANPLGYAYSWYCQLYSEWQRRLDVVLRRKHGAGERTFVDYAGQTVPVIDPKTGEVRRAQVRRIAACFIAFVTSPSSGVATVFALDLQICF